MPRPRSSVSLTVAAALLCLATACHADEAATDALDRPELGIMGTIPIYWGESGDFGEVLSGSGSAHWARAQLEKDFRLEPLDVLDAASLDDLDNLLLAQPRALSPAENVALDEWVRGGGHLLLFADPLLTGDSRFPIGDRRRPQDVILLSPILGHWGLRLEFDDAQPAGYSETGGQPPIPLNLPGRLVAEGDCAVEPDGVVARCAIGKGRVVVLADAAVLDLHDPHPGAPAALDWLLGQAFGNGTVRETGKVR